MDLSRKRAVEVFFKDLNIEHPTKDQLKVIEPIDNASLTKSALKKMLDEKRTHGEIANKLGVSKKIIEKRVATLRKSTPSQGVVTDVE